MTRFVVVKEPPEYVPPVVRVEAAPGVEFVKSTVVVTEPPGAIFPRFCGNGEPLVDPSRAVVNVTLLAVEVPLFWTTNVARTFVGLVRCNEDATINRTSLPKQQSRVVAKIDSVSMRNPPPAGLVPVS